MCKENRRNKDIGPAGKSSSEHNITQRVREFYEQYRFPSVRPPDQSGLILMRRMAKRVAQYSKVKGTSRMQVLDAGCGTGNTAISLARMFKGVDFLGVDISGSSLSLAEQATEQAGLQNIRFCQCDLMKPNLEESQFDIVLCLGVLHHTADMMRVLSNLNALMKDDGDLYLWVYGRHGRYRHFLNRRLLKMLIEANPAPTDLVHLAKEFALHVGSGIILDDLIGRTPAGLMQREVFEDPAWVADQFLSPNEISLDMEELLDLITATGFELNQWLGIMEDISDYLVTSELVERFERLPERKRLLALDLLWKPEHYFLALQKMSHKR